MGTSSARRAPTTRLWRLAKAAATRYLAPESGGVAAREVVARYIAALGASDSPGPIGALAAFRQTRRVAQNLGAFYCQADFRGWPVALEGWSLPALAGDGFQVLPPSLSVILEAAGGGLEQAVAHTALMRILPNLPRTPSLGERPAHLVQRFLVEALGLRLALDLGESLEAAASGIFSLRQGLAGLAAWIDQAAILPNLPPAPLIPKEWLGLPGWTWVSNLLTEVILNLTDSSPKYF